jgi:TusA-related sulfurtransferase
MTGTGSADGFLDLRGLPNPEPILELAEAAQFWDESDTVRVLSDDARFATDFVRWAGGTDLQILSLRYPTENLTEVILRGPARVPHRVST